MIDMVDRSIIHSDWMIVNIRHFKLKFNLMSSTLGGQLPTSNFEHYSVLAICPCSSKQQRKSKKSSNVADSATNFWLVAESVCISQNAQFGLEMVRFVASSNTMKVVLGQF